MYHDGTKTEHVEHYWMLAFEDFHSQQKDKALSLEVSFNGWAQGTSMGILAAPGERWLDEL